MTSAKHYNQDGTEQGVKDLPAAVFDCETNSSVVHQAVQVHLANQRQGTAKAKGRSDVAGGGKKPYRQKGTGRARAGTIRSPIWKGGGVVFGPHPREYRQSLPKKMRRAALCSSLTSRARTGDILVVDDLSYTEPSTKKMAELLKKLDAYQDKVLLVLDRSDVAVVKSARNIRGMKVTLGRMLNTYEVLWADKIIFTQSALAAMEEGRKND